MGNRISHVVTRTGDQGKTGLANGSRISKDSLRIHAVGEVDELNSTIGLIANENDIESIQIELPVIQNELFNLGAELAMTNQTLLNQNKIEYLELLIDSYSKNLPPLKDFILPGGCKVAALFHLARSVCRRAERAVVLLDKKEKISPFLYQYLNRLSDLFFIYARIANRMAKQSDIYWKK